MYLSLYAIREMKNLIIYLIAFGYLNVQAQVINELPFNLSTLVDQQTYSIKNIIPQIEGGKFYYFNQTTNEKEFENGFEEAYPFIGKSALIKDNGKYGVIDLKGNYLVQPIYNNYQLPPYEDESNLIIFSDDLLFDLTLGMKSENGYIICEEPAVPHLKSFLNQKNKYGIKNFSEKIIVKAKYDSIIDIHTDFFVVKLKDKIGVINKSGETLINFEYDDIIFSRGEYYTLPQMIGLKKDEKWIYFKIDGSNKKEILSSEYKCFKMHGIFIKNAVGLFKSKKGINILFENGETLKKDFDWISENGLIGIRGKSVFFLNPDGTATKYYD